MRDSTWPVQLAPRFRSSARPRWPTRARARTVAAFAAAVALAAFCTPAFDAEPSARGTIAVLEFDYVDSSGEPADQTAMHRARLATFMRSIRSDLERRGGYRVVPLTCDPDPCSTDAAELDDLVASARKEGVDYVLLGGFHKVSTLVQWARVQVIDVSGKRLAFDRLLSFRGDNDKAWQRTEDFLMKELLAAELANPAAAPAAPPAPAR
jgi:hypothetical protein